MPGGLRGRRPWRRAFKRSSALSRRAAGLAAILIGLAVVGPLLAPGFVLSYDMVFVPKPRFSPALLGLSAVPPRAVPSSLAAAVLSRGLTGQVAQKLVVFVIFAGAAWGAARLVPSGSPAAKVGAGLVYAWSPFTYERILIGHWALLVGFAALPFVVGASVDMRRDEPRAALRLAVALAGACAGGPYTGATGGVVALSVAAFPAWVEGRPWRRAATAAGLAVVLNLPWLVPALLSPGVPGRPLLARALFRARSDSPLGTVGSLVSLGGLWRTDLAPPGRSGFTWIPAFLLIAGLAWGGWKLLGRRWPAGSRAGLLAAAAGGLFLAAAPSIPGLDALARGLARLPGGGFIRDSQKFVMPLALAGAVGFGLGVERILDAVPATDRLLRSLAAGAAVLPVALAPSLVWGASGRLFTAGYPSGWSRANAIVSADHAPGGILALPWHAYLPFAWNRDRTVHQPALLYFARPVLASSALEVGRYRLPEEDPWARMAAPVVTGPGGLAARDLDRLGVRYVLLFKEADWRTQLPRLAGLAPVLDTPDLRLYRTGPARIPSFPSVPAVPVILGDLVAAGVLLFALVRLAFSIAPRPRLDILRSSKGGR